MAEVAREAAPGCALAVLSGPTFAHEVAAGLPTAVTLACGEGASAAEALAGLSSVAEGAHTAPVLAELARARGIDMPIVDAVCALLAGESPPREVVAGLLARPLRPEQGA